MDFTAGQERYWADIGRMGTDMRKLIIAILVLALPAWAFAGSQQIRQVVGMAKGSSDYCTGKLGSYSLYYDADHPDGTTTACISGSTTTVSATTGIATNSTTMNMTSGGTYGVEWDGALNHYLTVPATGLSDVSGRIEVKVKFPATMPTTSFQLCEWGSITEGTRLYLNYSATGAGGQPGFRLVVYHYDGTSTTSATGYVASTTLAGSAQTIVGDWSSSAGFLYADLGGTTQSSELTVTEFTEAANVYFGENAMGTSPGTSTGFDDLKIGASQQ